MKRKIILNLAISLDGYIADNDGHFDWIKGDGDNSNDSNTKFEFADFMNGIDTIVMGKDAYLDSPISEMFKAKKIYVITHKSLEKKYDNVEFISGDVCEKVLKLREEKGKDIWLFGGGISADPFIKANVVDEYILGIIPIILGEGRVLFLQNNPRIELALNECTVQEGIPILRYSKRK
jgi:dihydrofolate reductase